ncbi:MAG: hypothetical protein FJY67_11935 [Calditrichaeota bacterium]|nr:hypothetical protein [Calditrichota bacterium]
MKSRTLTLIIAAVMLIAVGVLVWPEPEEARADVEYRVDVIDDLTDLPIDNLELEISFWQDGQGQWGQWLEMDNVGNGIYLRVRGSWATHWRVRIVTATVAPVSPDDNPHQPSDTVNQFTWRVTIFAR